MIKETIFNYITQRDTQYIYIKEKLFITIMNLRKYPPLNSSQSKQFFSMMTICYIKIQNYYNLIFTNLSNFIVLYFYLYYYFETR